MSGETWFDSGGVEWEAVHPCTCPPDADRGHQHYYCEFLARPVDVKEAARVIEAEAAAQAWDTLGAPAISAAMTARLRAFGTEMVTHGDMTPMAKRMLERILDGES